MLSRAPPSANPMQHLEVRVFQQNGPKGDGRDRGLGHVIGGRGGRLPARSGHPAIQSNAPRDPPGTVDREASCPCLLRIFYRIGRPPCCAPQRMPRPKMCWERRPQWPTCACTQPRRRARIRRTGAMRASAIAGVSGPCARVCACLLLPLDLVAPAQVTPTAVHRPARAAGRPADRWHAFPWR